MSHDAATAAAVGRRVIKMPTINSFDDTYLPAYARKKRDDVSDDEYDILFKTDSLYEERKNLKRVEPYYEWYYGEGEKEYRAKVTFDAPSSPEYLSYHSLYAMIYEHFRDTTEIEPLKDYEFVYCWRKLNKRLTFPFIRCLYGHLGFQVVEGDDPEDIVYLEFKP
jgi:hypothetical protein